LKLRNSSAACELIFTLNIRRRHEPSNDLKVREGLFSPGIGLVVDITLRWEQCGKEVEVITDGFVKEAGVGVGEGVD
jgi:hypothetical protein